MFSLCVKRLTNLPTSRRNHLTNFIWSQCLCRRLTFRLGRVLFCFFTTKMRELAKSTDVAALDVLPGLRRSGVCRFSPAEVFKALKHSYVPAAPVLFKMIRRYIFSWQWVHCSHLPVDFKAVSVGGDYTFPSISHQHGQLRPLSIITNGWLLGPSDSSVSLMDRDPLLARFIPIIICYWVSFPHC